MNATNIFKKIRRSNSYKPMNYRQADNLAEFGKKLKGWF